MSTAQAEALMKFSEQLKDYYTAVQHTVDHVLATCDRAQAAARALNATGVDPAATALSEQYTGLINRRQQLAVFMESLIINQQGALRKGLVPRFGLRLVNAGIATLLTPSVGEVNSAANDLQPNAAEKSEMDTQARNVQHAITDWHRDAAATAAAQADLLKSLKAKYSDIDWGFLESKGAGQ